MRSRIINRSTTSKFTRIILNQTDLLASFAGSVKGVSTKAMSLVHVRKIDEPQIPIKQSMQSSTGNTPLHEAITAGAQDDDIEAFIEEHGYEATARMAKTLNDDGYLALDYVSLKNAAILSKVSDLTLQHEAQPLVDMSSLEKQYELSQTDKLYQGLAVSTAILQDIAALNIVSSTKPEMNHVDGGISHASAKLNRLRKTVGRFFIPLAERLPNDYQSLKGALVDAEAFFVKTFRVGNCHEYAYLAINHLRQQDDSHRAEVFLLANGNHVFVVLNRDPHSDPSNYLTWGNEAVVLDAWANDTFPAADMAMRLKTNERHETYYMRQGSHGTLPDFSTFKRHNVATMFNPNYHRLISLMCIEARHEAQYNQTDKSSIKHS